MTHKSVLVFNSEKLPINIQYLVLSIQISYVHSLLNVCSQEYTGCQTSVSGKMLQIVNETLESKGVCSLSSLTNYCSLLHLFWQVIQVSNGYIFFLYAIPNSYLSEKSKLVGSFYWITKIKIYSFINICYPQKVEPNTDQQPASVNLVPLPFSL